jgi:hypothetical protein
MKSARPGVRKESILRRGRVWASAILVVILLLAGCSGSTSSLLGGPSSGLGGEVTSVPLRFSSELRGLPTSSPATWKPFSSNNLQVMISHPVDWSVKEQQNSIAFTSPDGAVTQLVLIGKSDVSSNGLIYDNDLPDTDCSVATNAHGVTIRACHDKRAESCTASFILQSRDSQARIFSLLTGSRSNMQVFEAMLASIRSLAL